MAQFSIHTTFHRFLQIQRQDVYEAVCIFGNISSGKSTLCHLLKRYINKVRDENFILEDGKYIYQNQINAKSIKPITIYPKLFQIKGLDQAINIVQIPSRIYQLQTKKRPNLDRILNTVGLTNFTKQISLVFMIQAKYTSSKVDTWKKTFHTIFDYFSIDQLSTQVLNSVGFIASKSDIDKKIFLNRFQLLLKNIDLEQRQLIRRQKYKNLVTIIQKNQKVAVMSKPTKDTQQNIQKQIKQIFDFLSKLDRCTIDEKILQAYKEAPINLIQNENKYLNEYLLQFQKIINLFKVLFKKILFQQGYKDLNKIFETDLKEIIQKSQKQIFGNGQQKSSQKWNIYPIQTRLNQIFTNSKQNKYKCQDIITTIQFYLRLSKAYSNNNHQNNKSAIKDFICILIEFGLISNQWKKIYSFMVEFQIFQKRFSDKISNLNFNTIFQSVFRQFFNIQSKKLISFLFLTIKIQKRRQQQYYNQIREIIGLLFPKIANQDVLVKQKIEFIQFQLLFSELNINNTEKQLPRLWQLRKSQILRLKNQDSKKLLVSFIQVLVKMLDKLQHYQITCNIYEKCGQYYTAKKRYQQLLQKQNYNIKMKQYFNKYLDLIIKMHLYQKALQVCYRYIECNSEDYYQIYNKIIQIEKIRMKNGKFDDNFMSKMSKQNKMQFQDYLNHSQIQNINNIVKNLSGKN